MVFSGLTTQKELLVKLPDEPGTRTQLKYSWEDLVLFIYTPTFHWLMTSLPALILDLQKRSLKTILSTQQDCVFKTHVTLV